MSYPTDIEEVHHGERRPHRKTATSTTEPQPNQDVGNRKAEICSPSSRLRDVTAELSPYEKRLYNGSTTFSLLGLEFPIVSLYCVNGCTETCTELLYFHGIPLLIAMTTLGEYTNVFNFPSSHANSTECLLTRAVPSPEACSGLVVE